MGHVPVTDTDTDPELSHVMPMARPSLSTLHSATVSKM